MILGNQKTEREYRDTETDSSSSLKLFSESRYKYYKKFVERGKIEEEELSLAATTGLIVDCLLLEPNEFDNRFFLSSVTRSPSGNMLLFVEALLRYSSEPYENFEEIARKAYKDSGYKWTFEKVLEKFVGSDSEIWYREASEVKSKGLVVVTLDQIKNAENIINELKTNEITKDIVNLVSSDRYLVQNQVKVEDFDIDGLPMKAMMDKVIIDRKEKTIQCWDLKVIFDVDQFADNYYFYRRAYIQAYVYKQACYKLKELLDLEYFTVLDPKYIVADSINLNFPLIYTLNDTDLDDAYRGFEYKGRKYPGVKTIVEDIKYCKENNSWRISRKNALNGGVLNIKS